MLGNYDNSKSNYLDRLQLEAMNMGIPIVKEMEVVSINTDKLLVKNCPICHKDMAISYRKKFKITGFCPFGDTYIENIRVYTCVCRYSESLVINIEKL